MAAVGRKGRGGSLIPSHPSASSLIRGGTRRVTMRSLDPIVGGPVGTGESPTVEYCAQQPSPNCEAEQRRVPELDLLAFPKGRGPQEMYAVVRGGDCCWG